MQQPDDENSRTTFIGTDASSVDGDLLADLEARQDEVIERLDDLEKQLLEILSGLGVTVEGEDESGESEGLVSKGREPELPSYGEAA
ncbi:MAG: hypothetical protein AAF664_14550 [Planctomycetota bacterium]